MCQAHLADRNQDPQYLKTAVLKIRSTKKPQYLKYDWCESKIFIM